MIETIHVDKIENKWPVEGIVADYVVRHDYKKDGVRNKVCYLCASVECADELVERLNQ